MLTKLTEENWTILLRVFEDALPRRGEKAKDNRRFLEALLYFTVHNVTWRALPAEFGNWNTVWKRFWRLSHSGVFEFFFETLANLSETAHLVQMFERDRDCRRSINQIGNPLPVQRLSVDNRLKARNAFALGNNARRGVESSWRDRHSRDSGSAALFGAPILRAGR